jgi:hypothetical protein
MKAEKIIQHHSMIVVAFFFLFLCIQSPINAEFCEFKTKRLFIWSVLLNTHNVESEEDVSLAQKNELQEMQKTNAAKV